MQLCANGGEGVALAAPFPSAVVDGLAFRCRSAPRRGGAEELAEVRVAGKVTHHGADGTDVQGKAPGQVGGRSLVHKVGSANLVTPLGRGRRLLE